jgi:hypothetical protein
MITCDRETQSWATKAKFNEIQDYIIEKRKEGYFITDFDRGNGVYSVIIEKGCGITEQRLRWSSEFDADDMIVEMWNDDFKITNLLYDGTDWIYVFSKFEKSYQQAHSTGREFPTEKIRKKWDDGYSISKIAYGKGVWVVVFTKGVEYNPGYVLRSELDFEEINKWISDEKIITDLVYGDGKWAIAFGKHTEFPYQVIEVSKDFPTDKIKKRWEDGYDITLCAYGDDKWVFAFSTKYKYSTIAKEKERISKETEEVLEKINVLYTEKNYNELINIVEANDDLKSSEEIINKYLWALWLNNDTEEKAWNLAKEYSTKFNTKRWEILKGHYSKWKKWYDFALDYYKESSKENYNEIMKILDDYYSLYEQKQYSDVIDYFEEKLSGSVSSKYLKIADKYLWALFKNSGTETKALEKVKKYLEDYPENTDWYNLAGHISKWLGDKEKDIDILNEAISYYIQCDNKEGMKEVNEKIKEANAYQKERIAEIKNEEKERIALEKQEAAERRESEERTNREEEEERERREKEEEENAKIGSHSFKSSVTRGGDAIFPEHIYVDDKEVSWEKKTGVFSKDSKTIPMKNITQIDIETSLIGANIKIRSKGFGFIQGENFTKSDVKEIKSLIEKAQGNL